MKIKIILILIVLLAFILRFYKLDIYPAINADEASNAYDAYSLLMTGMDQHGNSWPINFQSFNDFKPGLYIYLTMPFVKVLGLNSLAVRIPGALAGVLTVASLYFFIKILFNNEYFALISAGFLAISPWHIHFSRGGWEVNLSTFLILMGLTLLFYAKEKTKSGIKISLFVFSALSFVLSMYAYHAARVITPLIGIGYFLFYYKQIIVNFKYYLIFIFVGMVAIAPLLMDMGRPGALSRAAGVGLFADRGPISRINEQRGEHEQINSLSVKLLHNKIVNYGLAFFDNWTKHFNGEFLFMSGDAIERNKVPETGQLYLYDILFLFLSAIFLFNEAENKKYSKNKKFILYWLIVSPVASALTFQSPNALRSENMVIPLTTLSAFGAYSLFRLVYKTNFKWLFYLIAIIVVWNFGRYEYMYWKFMSRAYPYSSQYGVGEIVKYVSSIEDKYQNIFITGRYDQPYILYLFYTKYPPALFQNHHNLTTRDEYGFSTVPEIARIHFGPVNVDDIKNNYTKSLIVGTKEEIPSTENIIKKIYGTNGFEYFDIVEK